MLYHLLLAKIIHRVSYLYMVGGSNLRRPTSYQGAATQYHTHYY